MTNPCGDLSAQQRSTARGSASPYPEKDTGPAQRDPDRATCDCVANDGSLHPQREPRPRYRQR